MIRGWKNNPAWVKYYEKKQEKHIEEVVRRIQLNLMMDDIKSIKQGISRGKLNVRKPINYEDWKK